MLGTHETVGEDKFNGEVFDRSALETIRLPSTLEVVEEFTFMECKNLRSVEFAEGLKRIDAYAFA